MPSPFPGMDPYLERPSLWADVQGELISTYRALLNRRLLPRYVARTQERVYVATDDDPARKDFVPDIRVGRRKGAKGKLPTAGDARATEPVVVTIEPDVEVHEPFIEVVGTDARDVVAVIEMVSPSNKTKGSEGRHQFLAKRWQVLNSTAHWVEIDLLRSGERAEFRRRMADHEYLATVSPAGRRPEGLVWPIRLAGPLPVIGIPLRGKDPDVPLDLREALDMAYDRAAYHAVVDYSRDPTPKLPPDLAKWAAKVLKDAGLR